MAPCERMPPISAMMPEARPKERSHSGIDHGGDKDVSLLNLRIIIGRIDQTNRARSQPRTHRRPFSTRVEGISMRVDLCRVSLGMKSEPCALPRFPALLGDSRLRLSNLLILP